MYFIYLFLFSLLNVHSCFDINETVSDNSITDVSYIADVLLNLFGHHGENETQRIQELKEKLAKIDSYVVDREKYSARLSNESKLYSLNATNFYLALNEKDHFRFRNDSRNLYIKLKEKMNRDDLLQILAERGGKKTKKSARRMMLNMPNRYRDEVLDDAVDKYLGEFAKDDHSFRAEDVYSKYWDPEQELKERSLFNQKTGGRRIFKGERTNIGYYPFMTSIHIMNRFWCGGVLYWNDIVLTSAACLQLLYNNRFYRENPKVLAVRVGSNHSRFGGEMVEALEVYFHPSYNPRTLDNNIAVIRLQRQIKFTYHRVPKLIGLSDNEFGVPFTAQVLMLGWGVQKSTQKMVYEPMYLARKILPVYPNKFCKEIYGEKFNTRTMFCIGTTTTGEGACAHDAGGPAVLAGKLVGIISYGPAICGYPDAPTVLTLVGAYVDWIETVNETIPSYYRSPVRTTSSTMDPFLKHFKYQISSKPKFLRTDFLENTEEARKGKKTLIGENEKDHETLEESSEMSEHFQNNESKKSFKNEVGKEKIKKPLDSVEKKANFDVKPMKTLNFENAISEEAHQKPFFESNSKEHLKNTEKTSKVTEPLKKNDAYKTTKETQPRKIDPFNNKHPIQYLSSDKPRKEKTKTDDRKAVFEFDISSDPDDNKKTTTTTTTTKKSSESSSDEITSKPKTLLRNKKLLRKKKKI